MVHALLDSPAGETNGNTAVSGFALTVGLSAVRTVPTAWTSRTARSGVVTRSSAVTPNPWMSGRIWGLTALAIVAAAFFWQVPLHGWA
mmetsp:Transcript_97181/g.134986  ORF Transcript_97181/g.134986 Transcript_97181/m.134986 type:complete len:88 (-) Transcript_97181:996-1259(-)